MGTRLWYCQYFLGGKKEDLPAPAAGFQLEEQEAATAISDTRQRVRATLPPDHSGC